jgi:hypothetical protein
MDKNKNKILVFFAVMITAFPLTGAAVELNAAINTWPDPAVQATPAVKTASAAETKTAVFPEKQELLDLIADEKNPTEMVIDSAWGTRNPFDAVAAKAALTAAAPAPVPPKVIDKQGFILTGIVWTGLRPSAIINDEVVGIGSKVKDLVVKEIKEGAVTLTDGQNEVTLSPQK